MHRPTWIDSTDRPIGLTDLPIRPKIATDIYIFQTVRVPIVPKWQTERKIDRLLSYPTDRPNDRFLYRPNDRCVPISVSIRRTDRPTERPIQNDRNTFRPMRPWEISTDLTVLTDATESTVLDGISERARWRFPSGGPNWYKRDRMTDRPYFDSLVPTDRRATDCRADR